MKATLCRACDSHDLEILHDFGQQPLAGHFPTVPESRGKAKRYPLDLTLCRKCGLLQVTNLPPIGEVFHDNYRYSSSTIPGMARHFDEYAEWIAGVLPPGASIFEFGCNDGVLLERLVARGYSCAGIDASNNVAQCAREKGLSVDTGFLTLDYVRKSQYGAVFNMVTCSNVFAHIHQLRETLSAIRSLLVKGGLFAIEVHDGALLCEEGQFDTVYHEHLTYFTQETLSRVVESAGFSVMRIDKTSMHGGGLRLLARLMDAKEALPEGECPILEMTDNIRPQIDRCRKLLYELHRKHGALDAFGAAGRSQMFINITKSGKLFGKVFDDSPFRQGRFIAGTDIPIVQYAGETGSCLVILAWNYAPDIVHRMKSRFQQIVTLLPEWKVW